MRNYFLVGFLIGIFFWTISVYWIFNAINFYGAGFALSLFITFLLVAYLSIFFGIFSLSIYFFKDSKFRWITLPCVFFLLEWVRSWMISGFPWLNLGILFEKLWGALPLIGITGTSFVIIMIFCLIFEKKYFLKYGLSLGLLTLLLFGPGHYQSINGEKIKVAVIQPGENELEILMDLTKKANAEIIVWPEATGWLNTGLSTFKSASFNDYEVIGGFFTYDEDKIYSSIVNIHTKHFYNKRNLVPFGEFQPFGDSLKRVNKFFNISNSNISPGSLYQEKSFWSGLVCWELAFNTTFVERVRDTEFVIHVSNDSWYGQGMPEQHLKLAKARAVESNKWVVRSTTDGVSQIISPKYSQSSMKLNRGVIGSISNEIELNKEDTFYVIYGDRPLLFLCTILLVLAVLKKYRLVARKI